MVESGALGARHKKVDRLRRLGRQRSLRSSERAFVVEGEKVLADALDAGAALEAVFVDELSIGAPEVSALLNRCAQAGVRIHRLGPGVLGRVASTVTPQPLVAIAPWCDVKLDELADPTFLVVCADVRDPGNAGTVVRSAEAAGADGVVFCDGSVDVFNPKTVRSSAGSMFHVPIVSGGGAPEVLNQLGSMGLRRLGMVAQGGTPYDQVDLSSPIALVVGNEANGLPAGLEDQIDEMITIPMVGRSESLNVSMATAIVCFEVLRRRRGGEDQAQWSQLHERRREPRVDPVGMEIVATVSHELRSPLTAVKGYTALLLNRGEQIGQEQRAWMLGQVHQEADRVTRLIGELLDISRLETGRLVLRRTMVDVAALASSVANTVKLSYPDLSCSFEFQPEFPEVYADPDKLKQVMTNLLENACKYGSPLGVVIEGSAGDGFVSVGVRDQGEGISVTDLPKVFHKFFRRDLGRPSGSGLGLWISRGLVEAHGGTLQAQSVQGEGSVFRFTLPTDAFERLLEE